MGVRSVPVLCLALMVMALMSGCGEEQTAQSICSSNMDCRTGLICVGGNCIPLASIDADGDGVPDDTEILLGTDPRRRDTDGDGIPDNEELERDEMSGEWRAPDMDSDGVPDALEGLDSDADGDGVPDAVDPCDDDPDCPVEGGAHPPCRMLQSQPCVIGVGDCVAVGMTVCTPDGQDVTCEGDPLMPSAEACDDRDNDCDGETDEDFSEVGEACVVGVGVCRADGVWRCDESSGVVCSAEEGPPSDERCDGLDNDCDGDIDEDYPDLGADCMEGQGECARVGVIACDQESGASACSGVDLPEFEERCDGLDNDCDGVTDEQFPNVGQVCRGGEGVCASEGVVRCAMDGLAEVCDAIPSQGGAELCNTLDDDCDGVIDETFLGLGTPCAVGRGACAAEGVLVCTEDGELTRCSAEARVAEPERCDTIDNDCDGDTDEDFDIGVACTSGQGECEVAGQRICDPASGLLRCDARPSPAQPERCDTLDNDCDGSIDEAFPTVGDVCEIGLGECRAAGVIACSADGNTSICGANPDPLAAELCDGLDNDCDGRSDERLGLGDPCEVGQGACLSVGVQVCSDDGAVRCNAVALEGPPEVCDGQDNDCDQRIDEGFEGIGEQCLVGRGSCSRTGENECAPDGLSVACNVVAGAPEPELCDAEDNDCDGQFDEDFPDLRNRCTAGQGACERAGRRACAADGMSTICPAQAAPGSEETCNLFDDDCDGATDEAFPRLGEPCEVGLGLCRSNGLLQCSDDEDSVICDVVPGEPAPERCDQEDNDCDGVIDEDHDGECALRASAIGSASYETCAITPNGAIRCWGDAEGAAPEGRFMVLRSGDNFHCALDEAGRPTCWGARNNDRLDVPDTVVDHIALGLSGHGCLIDSAGATRCWGRNSAGETEPPDVALRRISSGMEFSCGLRAADGRPLCWGNPDFGVRMAPDIALVELDSGVSATCGIDEENGAIFCWGEDIAGQLDPPDGVFTTLSIGGYFGCAIDDAQALRCWGLDQSNQLDPPGGLFRAVSVGGSHACAVTTEGAVRCWGAGTPDSVFGFPNLGQASPP